MSALWAEIVVAFMLANFIALIFALAGIVLCDNLLLRCISAVVVTLTAFLLGILWADSVPEMEWKNDTYSQKG